MDGMCQKLRRVHACTEQAAREKCRELYVAIIAKIMIVLAVAVVIAVCMCVMSRYSSKEVILQRQGYGGESSTKSLETVVDGERTDFEVDVLPMQYTQDELENVFDKAFEYIDSVYLGDNDSPDTVDTELRLPDYIDSLGVSVDWISSNYEVVTAGGEVNNADENMDELVSLTAIVSYGDESAERDYQVRVLGKPMSKRDRVIYEIKEYVSSMQMDQPDSEAIVVPKSINGYEISDNDGKSRWSMVILLAVVAAFAIWSGGRAGVRRLERDREQSLLAEYPSLVDKITMYLGAGLTVRSAFERIEQGADGKSPLAMEIRYTLNEIKSGVSESEAYYNMGHRVNLPMYIKLMSLLSQNIRKGTRDLLIMMAGEEQAAVQARRELAKKKGEEAGTKLLFPMIVLLAVVMVIVVLPAIIGF